MKKCCGHPYSTEKLLNEDAFYVTGEISGTIRDTEVVWERLTIN